MANGQFPSNSKQKEPSKPDQPKKDIKAVVNGKSVKKKKSLGKQFTETFVGGDLKTAAHYAVFDVAIPGARDMIADSVIQGIERLIFGESRGPRRSGLPIRPAAGPAPGHVAYQRYSSKTAPPPPSLPHRQRAPSAPEVGDFDDILLATRSEAETVRERMGDIISQFGSASVADLYALANLTSNHTDQLWGWTDIRGTHILRNGDGGFILVLPDPTAF